MAGLLNASTVASIYQQYLGRAPDQAGSDYWLKSGASADSVASQIAGSQEAKDYAARPKPTATATTTPTATTTQAPATAPATTTTAAGMTAAQIKAIYGVALGRVPRADEIAYWTSVPYDSVINGIVTSKEAVDYRTPKPAGTTPAPATSTSPTTPTATPTATTPITAPAAGLGGPVDISGHIGTPANYVQQTPTPAPTPVTGTPPYNIQNPYPGNGVGYTNPSGSFNPNTTTPTDPAQLALMQQWVNSQTAPPAQTSSPTTTGSASVPTGGGGGTQSPAPVVAPTAVSPVTGGTSGGLLGASTTPDYQRSQNATAATTAPIAPIATINTAAPSAVTSTGYTPTNATATKATTSSATAAPVAPVSTYNSGTAGAVNATSKGYTSTGLDVTPEATSAFQLAKITGKGSELDQQSETFAKQQMGAKGLLNSSMAIGAAHDSVLKNAMPLALQDASTYARAGEFTAGAKNAADQFAAGASNSADLTNAQLGTSANITNTTEANKALAANAAAGNQKGLLDAQLATSTSVENAKSETDVSKTNANLGTSVSLANAEALGKAGQFNAGAANTAALATADNTLRTRLADIQANASLTATQKQLESQRAIADANNANNLEISKGDNATKSMLATMDMAKANLDTNTKIALANLDSATKTQLTQMTNENQKLIQTNQAAASMYQQLAVSIANIQVSKDLTGTAKAQAINTQVEYLRSGLATMTAVNKQNLGAYFPDVGYTPEAGSEAPLANSYSSPY